MAAEESSQGAALGPEFSKDASGVSSPPRPDLPDLYDVLGEYWEAQCVLQMPIRVLGGLMADATEEVSSCTVALQHGIQMLEAAYLRFDQGLLAYRRAGDDDDAEHDDESAAKEAAAPDSGDEARKESLSGSRANPPSRPPSSNRRRRGWLVLQVE